MNILKNKKKFFFISVLAISISFFSFKAFDDGDDFSIAKNLEIYHSVIRDIRLYYVDEVDLSNLIKESIDELLKKLDPYTVYYPESDIEKYTFMRTGAYGGIGASISNNGKSLIVSNVYKDSPAYKSGLKIGDEIMAIDGKRITQLNIKEIRKNIKGEPDSELNFSIKRYGLDKELTFKILRKKIQIKNITYSSVSNDNIAYIKIRSFKQNTASEFQKAYVKLNDSLQLKGLIIDLRGNPGGLLNEAVKIVNLFVPKNSVVVSTKGKVKSWNTIFKAKNDPISLDIPITVLVSNSSASASEIVAGAFQDMDRAVIIGQKTYGKGLVQSTRDLAYNTKIKITTAKYYVPSGRCIQIVDYSHRNADGTVSSIPDSLIKKFTTNNGRTVLDAGGIIPDIKTTNKHNTPIIKSLIRNRIIFNFCTKYFYEHPQISEAHLFKIDDKVFENFENFATTQEFDYSSQTYRTLNKLLKTAEKENYSKEEILKITKLKDDFVLNKKQDIRKSKAEIQLLLEREIVLRYYLSAGLVDFDMNRDSVIGEAKIIINAKDKYNKILNINN